MYNYLFGPVPSRRLGMSLGVDLVPKKVCSLDCVYCEVGKTTLLTTERKEYILYKKVVEELSRYFENNEDPDYITFSGFGEPTLNLRIGDILQFIKSEKPEVPVAVLTNGTLFSEPEVRSALKNADLILPSLDAATEKGFQKINRPAGNLKINEYIDGLVSFRKEFKGRIWLEVLILPGYNNNEEELHALKEAILKIKPDSVQLNTLDRPGTETDLRSATREELRSIIDFWGIENVTIIAASPNRKNIRSYREDAEATIMKTIERRPCTVQDLSEMTGLNVNEVNKYLDVLDAEDKIETNRQKRGVFYKKKTL